MGYYTVYSLTKIKGKSEDFDALNEDLRELGIDLDSDCNLKWYDHETDLENLTKKYPDLVVELEGDGEDVGDYWKKRFKNGICEYYPHYRLTTDAEETKARLNKKIDSFTEDFVDCFNYFFNDRSIEAEGLERMTISEIRDVLSKIKDN